VGYIQNTENTSPITGTDKITGVDLAVMVEVDPFGPEPLGCAAGFVMHGFWGVRVLDGDVRGFGAGVELW
jgi:hypothetical protein